MANDKMEVKKPAEPKAKPPTQDELNGVLEELVKDAELAGRRDEPVVTRARALLDRREGGKNAP